jgi:hypothetical protein
LEQVSGENVKCKASFLALENQRDPWTVEREGQQGNKGEERLVSLDSQRRL